MIDFVDVYSEDHLTGGDDHLDGTKVHALAHDDSITIKLRPTSFLFLPPIKKELWPNIDQTYITEMPFSLKD